MTSSELLDGVVTEILGAVRSIPGVGDATAVVRKGAHIPTRPAPRVPAEHTGRADRATEDRPAVLDGGPVHIPDGAPTTLQQALRAAAGLAPDKGTIYLTQDHPDDFQSYPQLLSDAERVLAGLRAAGLRPGDAALFVFDDNRGYLTAFWACVLGGFVPTPVAVAISYETPNEVNRKLHNAWNLLDRPVLVTDRATAAALAGVRTLWNEPGVRILSIDRLLDHPPDTDWFAATPDSPVLNLLTSGSTGVPKCVQHTNASVVARSYAVIEHCGLGADDVSLIWMPFDHVTVAYYNVRDVFLRCLHINAKTNHFLADCLLWLDWIDRYRATNTWAPNFAYAMVTERAAEIHERSWDLSCVREMVNAGEPVIVDTSHRFLELLAPHGLRADAMTPCWGMSETCSGVTYTRQSRVDRAAGTVAIDPASLSGTVRHLDPHDRNAVVLSTVGRPIPGVRLRIVDPAGQVVGEDRLGELRIRGRTMKHSYFGNAQAQRESYDEHGWFRTGDLAFAHDGEIVIAGRIKDQIIVRGINYMAHELESVVERVDGVRVTFSAAVGVREPGAETDTVVVFFVPERTGDLDDVTDAVRTTLVRETGLAPDLLVPLAEAEFPKTGSGKKQRAALVERLRAGAFDDRTIGIRTAGETSDTWFVRRQWVEPEPDGAESVRAGGTVLVLAAESDGRYLGRWPRAGESTVLFARPGDRFVEEAPGRFRVAATDPTSLRQLFHAVTDRYGPLSTVVFGLALRGDGDVPARLENATTELTALVAALTEGELDGPRVLVLTTGAVRVRPTDRVDLGSCALPALVRTAAAEAAAFTVGMLDLPADRDGWAAAVHADLARPGPTEVVAAWRGSRWVPKLAPVSDDPPTTADPPVTAGGLYLVTGGLGGIAHEISGYLLASYGVRLLLVGRSPADGDKARRLAGLTALGDVAYHRLDIADGVALEAAVSAAEARWNRRLDGVLHLAGADPTDQWQDLAGHTLANESPDTFAAQYRAKVAGTLAVAAVLDSRPDASLVLFGSVNGEFGGHSFGAYSAANGFLAGFADHWRHERGRPVRYLAWSMWTGVGMNRAQPTTAARHRGFRAIEPEDGLRLFLDAVATPHHSLIVGLDLTNPAIVAELVPDHLRVDEILVAYTATEEATPALHDAIAAARSRCPVPVRPVAVAVIPKTATGDVDTAQLLLGTAHDRRGRAFAPPASDLEREIALIWSDALNRPEVGRDDSFFELGGNSLRATRLLALVDARLAVRLTAQQLYESPTVAGMAAMAGRQRVS